MGVSEKAVGEGAVVIEMVTAELMPVEVAGSRQEDDLTAVLGEPWAPESKPWSETLEEIAVPQRGLYSDDVDGLERELVEIDGIVADLRADADKGRGAAEAAIAKVQARHDERMRNLRGAVAAQDAVFSQMVEKLLQIRAVKARVLELINAEQQRVSRVPVAWSYGEDSAWCPFCRGSHYLRLGVGFASCRRDRPGVEAMVLTRQADPELVKALTRWFGSCRADVAPSQRCRTTPSWGVYCARHRDSRPYGSAVEPQVPQQSWALDQLRSVDLDAVPTLDVSRS